MFIVSCSAVSEKDVVGKWTNTKSPIIWMEFFADKTFTGGKWSLLRDGTIQMVNPDGAVLLGKIKDGKLIIEDFGELGVFAKEGKTE